MIDSINFFEISIEKIVCIKIETLIKKMIKTIVAKIILKKIEKIVINDEKKRNDRKNNTLIIKFNINFVDWKKNEKIAKKN